MTPHAGAAVGERAYAAGGREAVVSRRGERASASRRAQPVEDGATPWSGTRRSATIGPGRRRSRPTMRSVHERPAASRRRCARGGAGSRARPLSFDAAGVRRRTASASSRARGTRRSARSAGRGRRLHRLAIGRDRRSLSHVLVDTRIGTGRRASDRTAETRGPTGLRESLAVAKARLAISSRLLFHARLQVARGLGGRPSGVATTPLIPRHRGRTRALRRAAGDDEASRVTSPPRRTRRSEDRVRRASARAVATPSSRGRRRMVDRGDIDEAALHRRLRRRLRVGDVMGLREGPKRGQESGVRRERRARRERRRRRKRGPARHSRCRSRAIDDRAERRVNSAGDARRLREPLGSSPRA